MLKRVPKQDDTIPVRDLKSNQVAEVVTWLHSESEYVGLTVMRVGCDKESNVLVSLNNHYFWFPIPLASECRVRLLLNGTMFEVVDNQLKS